MKIRILELCAGYGSQALALKNLGFDVYSEIAEFDKYASQAYMQLHGETKNYGDIYTIDETKLPYFDIITYSTPCQDFSVAGKGKGGDKGSGTRSSLLWECERIIRAVKPKYLLMENVKNLLGKKHSHNFNEWFKVLEGMGYTNYYKVLNAKDYGIPQNRERIFCVSILGGGQYLFPNPIPLEKRLKDMLEDNVPKKYYLSDDKVKKLINNSKEFINNKTTAILSKYGTCMDKKTDVACTLMARDYKGFGNQAMNGVIEPICAASRGRNPENPSDRTIGSPTEQRLEINYSGCTNTLTSVQKDNYVIEPKVIQRPHGFNKGGIFENAPTITSCGKYQDNNFVSEPKIVTVGNYMPSNHSAAKIVSPNGITPTVMENHGTVTATVQNHRIRKLTPRECWRLMGVKDEQFDRLHDISNSQLYKLAGNSIVVDVLEAIFRNLLMPETTDTKGQLTLF